MSLGVARGCFSHEAGMGSAAIPASAATTDNHVRQGYINSTGTFWDTFVVCTVTRLSVLTSGVMDRVVVDGKGASGRLPDHRRFPVHPGPHRRLAGGHLPLALFAFSTILGWEYHGEKALEYLTRSTKVAMLYRLLFSVIAFVGCVSAFEIAWNISDILNALMVVPNAIIMWMLVGPLVKDMDAFQHIKRKEKAEKQAAKN